MFLAVGALALVLIAAPLAAEAQRLSPDVRRIGYLQAGISGLPASFYEVLRDGLRDLGYVEGRNLVIEYRFGEDRAPAGRAGRRTGPAEP